MARFAVERGGEIVEKARVAEQEHLVVRVWEIEKADGVAPADCFSLVSNFKSRFPNLKLHLVATEDVGGRTFGRSHWNPQVSCNPERENGVVRTGVHEPKVSPGIARTHDVDRNFWSQQEKKVAAVVQADIIR